MSELLGIIILCGLGLFITFCIDNATDKLIKGPKIKRGYSSWTD